MTEVRAYSKQLDTGSSQRITRAIQRLTTAVFTESQKLVPVSSGYLKESGKYFVRGGSVVIHYTAPYSDEIENGREGVSGGYYTPSGRGTQFGRTAVNFYRGGFRPVPVGVKYNQYVPSPEIGNANARANSPWRVLDLSADLEPRYFIRNAYLKVFGDGRRKGTLQQLNINLIPKKMQNT